MILVFGASGQVGRALTALPGTKGLTRAEADLSAPGACAAAISAHAPRAVINAAAWTDVDGAEDAPAQAMRINAEAPAEIAAACAQAGLPLVHLSSDYVFDGGGTEPRRPEAPVAPLNLYGQSKAAGEAAIRATGAQAVLLRSAWVFDAVGANFVTTMLRLGRQHDTLRVVDDQIGGPTPAAGLASACHSIARQMITDPTLRGTYHLSGAPEISWAGFARAIFAASGQPVTVTQIPSSAYPQRARRPLNSRLDCDSSLRDFGLARPDWRAALTQMFPPAQEPRS